MKLPVLSQALAAQIRQSETDYVSSRISSIREREGNPEGAEIVSFGQATAYYMKTMPWSVFNTVKSITDEDEDCLEDIVQYYTEKERAFQIDVDPVHCSSRLMKRMAASGLVQNGFHSVLYGQPRQEMPGLPPHISIKEIKNKADFDSYAEIHCLGSGMSLSDKHHFINNNIGLLHRPGWSLFLAYIDHVPAGVAAMHISSSIASCTLAATVPQFRNRGVQSALLHRRMYEAGQAGCKLVAAQASFGSTSQNNMKRAGFQIAWTRAVWGPLS